MGYYRAGFEVVGVDIRPQPHYPFEFHQADALDYLSQHYDEFDVIHASPPCQRYSNVTPSRDRHPDLLRATVEAVIATEKPFVIENVPGSPMQNYLMLCGTMFGLKVFRHRWFMTNPAMLMSPASCNHAGRSVNSYRPGRERHLDAKFITVTGWVSPVHIARLAMGIHWMTREELVQAIPPAYTEWIGTQMMKILFLEMNKRALIEEDMKKGEKDDLLCHKI